MVLAILANVVAVAADVLTVDADVVAIGVDVVAVGAEFATVNTGTLTIGTEIYQRQFVHLHTYIHIVLIQLTATLHFLHARAPSSHVWLKCGGSPHLLNQLPPEKQQLPLPEPFLVVPHLEHVLGEVVVVIIVAIVSMDI